MFYSLELSPQSQDHKCVVHRFELRIGSVNSIKHSLLGTSLHVRVDKAERTPLPLLLLRYSYSCYGCHGCCCFLLLLLLPLPLPLLLFLVLLQVLPLLLLLLLLLPQLLLLLLLSCEIEHVRGGIAGFAVL